jgi:methionyl-tRNA synthetase
MDAIEVRKAAGELRAIWVAGNEYLQAAAPWAAFKEDPDRAAAIIRLSLNLIRLYAVLSAPFIPDTADALCAALQTDDRGLARRLSAGADHPAARPCL